MSSGRANEPMPRLKANEFRVVTLPEPLRRCVLRISMFYGNGRVPRHTEGHSSSMGGPLPQRWSVAHEVEGISIAVGTTLGVVSARHQVFHEGDGWDVIDWLLEPLDGPGVGAIYYVRTTAERDEDHGYGVDWVAAGHPLWPSGLDPFPTLAARDAQHRA